MFYLVVSILPKLDESKQLVIKRYREARDHHRNMRRRFESIYKKMIANHSKEHFQFHAAIEERDRKIHKRDAVISQLKDANEKLEVALKAMTKVAEDALRAKKQVRDDLKKLKSKHLKDIRNLTVKHEAVIEKLRSSISLKVSALHELETTKAKLVEQLQAREKELQLEIKMRMERNAASYDVDSAKRLLLEGAARNNNNANARAMKKEQNKQAPKQLPPSPREIQVRHECHWLHEQITATIQKIVNAKSDIEKMEFSFNRTLNEKANPTTASICILPPAEKKPLSVQTDN
jgi:DNA repair exonuclease SbcCD ATPase subunit